jgi:hypothetical protein
MKALTGPVLGFAAALLLAFPAMAQNTSGSGGSTTGPATGGNVAPSTAVQKENPASTAGAGHQGSTGQATGGAMGAGAPGMAAKPGSEGGPSPKSGVKRPGE